MRNDEADFELMVRWRNQPHVREWWDPDAPPLTLDGARAEYEPELRPSASTRACIIEHAGRPIGYVQFYPWAAETEELRQLDVTVPDGSWGLDLFIGDPDAVGRGIGPAVVDLMCRHVFETEGSTDVVLWAAKDNHRALRAYEKAGLRRVGEVLDTDTKNGERVWSWVLRRAG
ncbi:MAG: GNAT family N-acetyltransferase [Actinomycetota bacterium]